MDKQPDGHGAHKALSENSPAQSTPPTRRCLGQLTIRGRDSLRALERICPIDLHPDSFEVEPSQNGDGTFGHVMIKILMTNTLMLPVHRQNHLHAIETSIENVL